VPRAPLWLCLPAALACASSPPLPDGVPAEPLRGDSLALLLVKLQHAEDPAPSVEVRELHLSAVDHAPWQPLAREAADAYPGRLAVVAGRRCHWRAGLERVRADTGSWYLLERNALVAFDHQGFGTRCEARPTFEFLPPADAELERNLVRWVSQRYPVGEVPGDVRLARGLSLLAQGRRDDAQRELFALDRRLREVARLQDESETPDAAEREQLRREEERLRPLRAKLAHALQDEASGGTQEAGTP
jgi:hypothetical protein